MCLVSIWGFGGARKCCEYDAKEGENLVFWSIRYISWVLFCIFLDKGFYDTILIVHIIFLFKFFIDFLNIFIIYQIKKEIIAYIYSVLICVCNFFPYN